MATVRIYKIAELLGVPSQEVLSLLKSVHGIELKSASSTLEEVVARSFVERTARERKISLPSGDMFSGKAAPKGGKGGKKAALAKAEPPQAVVPVLGPPRLVKTIRPAAPPTDEDAASLADVVGAEGTPTDPLEASTETVDAVSMDAAPDETASLGASEAAAETTAPPEATTEAAADETTPAPGRFIPPTLRLRIEVPGQTLEPSRPRVLAKRPQVTQPRLMKAAPPASVPPVPGGARPGGARPWISAPSAPDHTQHARRAAAAPLSAGASAGTPGYARPAPVVWEPSTVRTASPGTAACPGPSPCATDGPRS